MRTGVTLLLSVLAITACGGRREEGGGGTAVSPGPGEAAGVAAKAKKKHKIDVVMRWNGSKCEIVDPGTTVVSPDDEVYWRYKNKDNCKGTQTERIVFTSDTPVDGGCENDTAVGEGQELDGPVCLVDANAPTGGKPHKYTIHGSTSLDPELDIQPPPPPPERKASTEAGGTESVESAGAAAGKKILVVMWWNGTKCVADDPGTTKVHPGQKVRWRYLNKGKPPYKEKCRGPQTQRITFKSGTPVDGDCKKNTVVGEDQDVEGDDCQVDPNARTGGPPHKYKIDGSVELDPELDIQPPPPPPERKAAPTPSPK